MCAKNAQSDTDEPRIHNQHDFFFRLFMERIRGVNILLFKLMLPSGVFFCCDWTRLKLGSASVYNRQSERRIDAVAVVDYRRNDGVVIPLYLPVEHKSYPDINQPLQLDGYRVWLYDKLRSMDSTAALLAIPCAVYLGAEHWHIPSLRDSLLRYEAKANWGVLEKRLYTDNFCRLHAWEIDDEILLADLYGVFLYVAKHARNLTREVLVNIIRCSHRLINNGLGKYVAYLLDYLFSLEGSPSHDEFFQLEAEEFSHFKMEDRLMAKYFVGVDVAREEGIELGIAQGIEQGIEQGRELERKLERKKIAASIEKERRAVALRMLKTNADDENILKVAKISKRELQSLKQKLK